jgi:hypothetical protein
VSLEEVMSLSKTLEGKRDLVRSGIVARLVDMLDDSQPILVSSYAAKALWELITSPLNDMEHPATMAFLSAVTGEAVEAGVVSKLTYFVGVSESRHRTLLCACALKVLGVLCERLESVRASVMFPGLGAELTRCITDVDSTHQLSALLLMKHMAASKGGLQPLI